MDNALQEEQSRRIREISRTIRQGLRDALPGPDDQFFTLMIPGKVLDFGVYGADYNEFGERKVTTPSLAVQLAEASLCDDMPSYGPLQLGPTGRSVARSYAATLSRLCPNGSTTGISDETPPEKLSPAEKRYQHAMNWLTFRDPNHKNQTRMDVYRDKQTKYTDAFEKKTTAYSKALSDAEKDPVNTSIEKKREAYDKWVNANYKTYNNIVQAAYMDWVTMGKKEEVEYYFSIVDNDSAMARVEASKECMRASVIADVDGSSEYHKVKLEPQNWAFLAKQKAAAGPQGETAESLTFRINRLEKINFLLTSMKDNATMFSTAQEPVTDSKAVDKSNEAIDKPNEAAGGSNEGGQKKSEPGKNYLEKQKKFDDLSAEYAKKSKDKPEEAKGLLTKLQGATKDLGEARDELRKHFEEIDRKNVQKLSADARIAQKAVFDAHGKQLGEQIDRNQKEIDRLETQRQNLEKLRDANHPEKTASETVQDDYADKAGIVRAPVTPPTTATGKPNYWTSISIEVSSSFSNQSQVTSTTSSTVETSASIGWGPFRRSVSVGVAHQQSYSAASREMANASMRISFECMRVDITRSWLRGELFYDHELRVPEGEQVSPGNRLAALIDRSHPDFNSITDHDRAEEMKRYDLFPMYPTGFLLAANVVLEIHGETSSMQSYLSSSSTGGSAALEFGPFKVGGSAAGSSSSSRSSCKSTASGCRITIDSPQIIGWISQIVPELPRAERRFVLTD